MLFCFTGCTKRCWRCPSSGGHDKPGEKVTLSGGTPITNYQSPAIIPQCSRSDGYGVLMLALGRSHDLPFHFSVARGQNLERQSPTAKCQCRGLNYHSLQGSSIEDQSSTTTRHAPILQVFSRTHIQIIKLVSGFKINRDH